LQFDFSTSPESYGLDMRRETVFGGIDSYRRAPKMAATCRPEKAARFVFQAGCRCNRANACIVARPNLQ